MDVATAEPRIADTARWWERRWLAAVMVLLTALPFVIPRIPPLVDLPAHMARYRVALDLANSPELQRYFGYHWRLISNLGVDVLVVPLARLVGLEPATKLIVLLLPMLTAAGLLRVATAAHGRVPPTFWFALPFALASPLLFGFVNFVLGAALALLVFGYWLGRRSPWLLAVAAPVLMIAHLYGWAMLGLMVAGAVLGEGFAERRPLPRLARELVLATLPLATALVLLPFMARSDGVPFEKWFDLNDKVAWAMAVLRDRWPAADIGSAVLALLVIILGWRRLPLKPVLAGPALLLIAFGLILPYKVMGSAFADMRLYAYAFAIFILAIDSSRLPARTAARVAALGLAFALFRIGVVTASNLIAAREQASMLSALDRVPVGTRLAALVGQDCTDIWQQQRHAHFASLVTVRRNGFSNDQWPASGINPLERRYRPPNLFDSDPSELTQPQACVLSWTVDVALAALPRDYFDYALLIGTERPKPASLAGLTPVWRDDRATLYRVDHPRR
ncbi:MULTISPECIES: hypothetical protein [Sphingomonas]|uniref:hypothetical protein n=1 Tax=Sphingomonas TaxID=13687 RepID=UPI00126A6E3C|nr:MULTISPECIES: hypothetical protein [Sphingomonas]